MSVKGSHVGGDRSRNGLPESCSGYVYRGGKRDPRCEACGSARRRRFRHTSLVVCGDCGAVLERPIVFSRLAGPQA